MSNTNPIRDLAIGFLVGAAVGLTLGVLYAPRPGREIRQRVRERGREARETAEKIIHEAQEKAENIIEQARPRADALLHRKREKATEAEPHAQEVG